MFCLARVVRVLPSPERKQKKKGAWPRDAAHTTKSKREASRQFAAKFRKTQDRERLQKRVNYLKRGLLKWQAQRMITEDRCKELEKKIAAKRLALRQR